MKRVISINFLVLFLFLSSLEILLGKWIKNIFLNEKTEYLNIGESDRMTLKFKKL